MLPASINFFNREALSGSMEPMYLSLLFLISMPCFVGSIFNSLPGTKSFSDRISGLSIINSALLDGV